MSFFDKIKAGMSKTRTKLNNVFANFRKVDEDLMEELEEALILCDMGVATTETVMEELRERVKLKNIKDADEVKAELVEIIQRRDHGALGQPGRMFSHKMLLVPIFD